MNIVMHLMFLIFWIVTKLEKWISTCQSLSSHYDIVVLSFIMPEYANITGIV